MAPVSRGRPASCTRIIMGTTRIMAGLKCIAPKCEDAASDSFDAALCPPRASAQSDVAGVVISAMRMAVPFTGADRLRGMAVWRPVRRGVCACRRRSPAQLRRTAPGHGMRARRPVSVLGLSNVFTFPPYRRKGHASAMMHAVGELINDSDAELAILFCESNSRHFYAARGWQLVRPARSGQRAPRLARWSALALPSAARSQPGSRPRQSCLTRGFDLVIPSTLRQARRLRG